MQNQASFREQCVSIIEWRTRNLSPQSLFKLPEVIYIGQNEHPISINYTEEQIKSAYKRLARKFHPDKNRGNADLAKQAFDVIKEARDYLLYTINRDDSDIQTNAFYLYLHKDTVGNHTQSDRIEGMIREGYRLKMSNQDMSSLVLNLFNYLKENPNLVHYECDSFNMCNYQTGGKSILYAAAQWNQSELFKWLLEQGADPLAKTNFGVSPLDIAITSGHYEILSALSDSPFFGKERLKAEMEKLFQVNDRCDADNLLKFYMDFLSDDFDINAFIIQFPLMIPALHHLDYLSREQVLPLYKKYIIGCPELYRYLNEAERTDPFILIATLAQNRAPSILMHIPAQKLPPELITALCDFWPELECHINEDTTNPYSSRHGEPRASTLPSFQIVKNILLGTLICIVMLVLAYHFWPIIALWPEFILQSIVMPIGAGLVGLGASGVMISAKFGYDYATKVYPETCVINKILVENNFFKSNTALATELPDASETTSVSPL